MRILLVENNFLIVQWLTLLANKQGHDLDHVRTGGAALKKIKTDEYHLAVLDLFPPDITGPEFVRRFKARAPHTAIVAVTAKNTRNLERAVRRQGVLFYLIKPFELKYLKIVLEPQSGKKSRAIKVGRIA